MGGKLVIGPGASGVTNQLEQWAPPDAVWIKGNRFRPVDLDDLPPLGPAPLVIDGVEGLTDEAVEALAAHASAGHDVWAGRRPWPTGPSTHWLDDALTQSAAAVRLGPLDPDELATVLALASGAPVDSDTVDRIHRSSGGLAGLAVMLYRAELDGAGPDGPGSGGAEIADRLHRHAAAAGAETVELCRLAAVGPDEPLNVLLGAFDGDRVVAERAASAGGVVVADRVVPAIAEAFASAMGDAERAHLGGLLVGALRQSDPARAVEYAVRFGGPVDEFGPFLLDYANRVLVTDPETAANVIEAAGRAGVAEPEVAAARARLALWRGDPYARSAALASSDPDLLAAVDLAAMHWHAAANGEGIAAELARFAVGEEPDPDALDPLWSSLVASARAVLADDPLGVARLLGSLDDFEVATASAIVGLSPQTVAVGALSAVGRQSVVDQIGLVDSAPPFATELHRRLSAFLAAHAGDYGPANRESEPEPTTTAASTLVWAGTSGLCARRSGDVARMREAWAEVAGTAFRAEPSWLFADPLTELLATGLRLGEAGVSDALQRLAGQLECYGPTASVRALWLRTEIAIENEQVETLRAVGSQLDEVGADGFGSVARAWAEVLDADAADRSPDIAPIDQGVTALADLGERWQASRLAGRAGLAATDASTARRFLERARSLHGEVPKAAVDGGSELVNLGLSEREAEVAVLVAEGSTYKEIGAELFISAKTVEHHVARIKSKLGAGSRAEMIAAIQAAGPPHKRV